MFAARGQENLVHTHQTAAASKPLNQGTRQLQPKTPGNKAPKTPFKIPLNDENDALGFGGQKTGLKPQGKGFENIIRTTKKDGGLEKNAFATPMGPKNRAPLGMKTTNAKARAFQTPAPPLETIKPEKTNKKASTARKSKIQVAKTQVSEVDVLAKEPEGDVPDIEYMPPKPIELPDPPEDISYDDSFPQFKGNNFTRGYYEIYFNPIGEDGLTKYEREWNEQQAKLEKDFDDLMRREFDNMELLGINVRAYPDEPCAEELAKAEQIAKKDPQMETLSKLSTIKSRNAASALAQSKAPSSAAKPKVNPAPKPKISSSLVPSKKKIPSPSGPSAMRHTATTANSKTTVGYSKGRNVSTTIPARQPKLNASKPSSEEIDKSQISPAMYIQLYGEPPFGSEMWYRCYKAGCFDESEDNLEDILGDFIPADLEDEAAEGFELTL